jgi:hypothetical protein
MRRKPCKRQADVFSKFQRYASARFGDRRRTAYDQLRPENILRMRRRMAEDLVDQRPSGGQRHRAYRLAEGRQRRIRERHERRVIEAHDAHVVRYAQSVLAGGPDRAQRHEVGTADHSRRAPVEQPAGGRLATLHAEQVPR